MIEVGVAAATGSAQEVTEAGERIDPAGPTILDDHCASPLAPPPLTCPVPLLLPLLLGQTGPNTSLSAVDDLPLSSYSFD